jgi:hypothetical protein
VPDLRARRDGYGKEGGRTVGGARNDVDIVTGGWEVVPAYHGTRASSPSGSVQIPEPKDGYFCSVASHRTASSTSDRKRMGEKGVPRESAPRMIVHRPSLVKF